jgi:alpha-tubulin suppressor-like RCC1 family protein
MTSQQGHVFDRRRRVAVFVVLITALSVQLVGASVAGAAAGPTEILSSFGANSYGEVGNNTTTNVMTPTAVSGLVPGATAFAAAARHSLAILPDTSVVAWGRNDSGELGINNNTGPSTCAGVTSACAMTPVHVTDTTGSGTLTGALSVDGGAPACSASIPCTSHAGHSMALLSDGTVLGWGHDNSGQVGDGVALPVPALTNVDVLHPVPVVGLGTGSGIVAIAAGASHSLALRSDGEVLSWGNNKSGELGTGGTLPGTDASTPQSVLAASVTDPVVAIAAGDGFSVALKKDGSVWTWGNNASGQLGRDTTTGDPATPAVVTQIPANPTNPVIAISAGSAFVVALRKNNAVYAWGNNTSGELGNGLTTDSLTPVSVFGLGPLSGVTAIAAGSAHVIALRSSGTVLVWGHGSSGQLGNNSTLDVLKPKALAIRGVTRIAAGGAHTIISAGPAINAVTPALGKVATHISIAGGRFGPSETVTVVYKTNLVSPAQVLICTTTTSVGGAFTCPPATTVIPAANSGPAGAHALVATGGTSGLHASSSFTLLPTVAISPASGHAGAAVTVSGSHFKPGETVSAVYRTGLVSPATQALCSKVATATGTFSCAGHIPTTNTGALGAHTITATGSVTKTAGSTTFTRT